MKVVLDTMLWVSYCTREKGYRHRLIERARRQRVRLFVSNYIVQELTATLVEDLDLSKRYAGLARGRVLRLAKLVTLPSTIEDFVPGDPDDNPIVQTAFAAKADFLVTSDKEILKIRKIQDLLIIAPKQWERLLA